MRNFFLELLQIGAIVSTALVITANNPVIAVVYLILAFINAAGYLILLGIGFIGISYIIVYIGAITVLFLFVIMMINISLTDILEVGSEYTKSIPLALSIGFVFVFELFNLSPNTLSSINILSSFSDILTILNSFTITNVVLPEEVYMTLNPSIADVSFSNFLQIEAIAQLLYTTDIIWLIMITTILLLSIIASIFISKN